ncbi:hypothetical protein CK203_095303 [Vitis vinifera]|uniref:Endonuclease/exonuclease/phosphatase domain-containing protein n=1 Tax=Vitis vinifera TaxID=29760 RepID=A0A438D8D1_VITVI|nr:hypothetical protein CK203_095303 [Vitis vinifera]
MRRSFGRFRNVEDGNVWVFTGVYDPFSKVERDALWEEFGAIRGLWEDPWCIGGDFNITLFSRERRGDFTWNGGLHNQSWARLDSGGGIRRGPTPFRFENMWLKAEGFKELVRSWWQGIDVRGSASYKLATK